MGKLSERFTFIRFDCFADLFAHYFTRTNSYVFRGRGSLVPMTLLLLPFLRLLLMHLRLEMLLMLFTMHSAKKHNKRKREIYKSGNVKYD